MIIFIRKFPRSSHNKLKTLQKLDFYDHLIISSSLSSNIDFLRKSRKIRLVFIISIRIKNIFLNLNLLQFRIRPCWKKSFLNLNKKSLTKNNTINSPQWTDLIVRHFQTITKPILTHYEFNHLLKIRTMLMQTHLLILFLIHPVFRPSFLMMMILHLLAMSMNSIVKNNSV